MSWKIVADAKSERRPSTTPKSVETGRLEEEGGKVEPWKKQG